MNVWSCYTRSAGYNFAEFSLTDLLPFTVCFYKCFFCAAYWVIKNDDDDDDYKCLLFSRNYVRVRVRVKTSLSQSFISVRNCSD